MESLAVCLYTMIIRMKLMPSKCKQNYLKDRCERELSTEHIVHYGKVVSALGEMIRIMREVDAAIDVNGGWPVT